MPATGLSIVNRDSWNEQFVKFGEAAFTLDPLSSSGVEKAMRFSLQAAIAINTYFKNPGSAYPKDNHHLKGSVLSQEGLY